MSKGRSEAAAGASGILLKYLQEQNRPYSAQDVFGNLQREHGLGKTAVVKALEQLAQQGKIKEKMYGKQKIYFADQKEIQELKKECAGYRERLKNIKAATNHVTPEEKEQVYKERQRYHKEWRRRKRMATELSDAILEGYPKSKKQFFEEVGIETDEDHNVKLPDP
ncbi:PREDICTED: homologous-pairing protein 2 homolog isoform X2 [Capra hircus]|uniref:homologous-pairing protein 2 homolog isoform X2 n=1 Tax=Capra hircus TaxID=9925 RepID=UPI0006B11227|nr:PREDICTED: homologous-pairing protein 2 homolog isoform X2 [Capra hircus]